MSDRSTAGNRRASGSGVEKAWASGRILTPEQRARKQEADRKANRFLKKEVQDRLSQLEARVLELEKTAPSEQSVVAGDLGADAANISYTVPGLIGDTTHIHGVHSNGTGKILEWNGSVNAQPNGAQGTVYEASTTDDNTMAVDSGAENGNGTAPDYTDLNTTTKTRPEGRHLTCFLNNLVNYIRHLSPTVICFDDQFNQDLVASAVFKGWDSTLSRYSQKCPLWEVLRLVDMYLFKDCNVMERIGMMRMLHKRYLFEVNANLPTAGPPPPWFRPQFSEKVFFHDPVIDHLAWPRLRERMITSEQDRMTNRFWSYYIKNIAFTWQSEPVGIVSYKPETALYQFASSFETALVDIGNWRMEMDFFRAVPQLAGDVPPHNYMPLRTIAPKFGADGARQAPRSLSPRFGMHQQQPPPAQGQQAQPPQQEPGTEEDWWRDTKGLPGNNAQLELTEISPAPGGVWQDFYT
ncbi:hypothetical protein PRZ48_000803 [Zasmidium cellare]|uniref:BZIP domain-containing protein n=1 Tax=Zasmidium cellare TaxID=395010 RepID=A0ABR0EZG4_ZASCE|nr:hypothetical protein PRZ48_000803 [Zasmidium cellare]